MRIPAIRILIATTLVAGCAAAENSRPSPAPGTGGAAGTGQAGSGGAPGGTGGSPTAGSGGGGAPSGGSGGATTPDAAPPPAPSGDDAGPPAEPVAPGAFPGCPKCKPIFDGTTLNGWIQDPAGSFEVKAGVIASTGKGAHAWTKDDYGEFRIIFSV